MKAPSDTDPVKRLTEDVQLRTPGVSAQRREHDVGTPLDLFDHGLQSNKR